MQELWKSDLWWTSHLNFHPDVRSQFDLPAEVQIHDATLRDGEQTPGVVLRKDDKIRIAEMLEDIGVHRIEAGMPAVSQEDFDAIKEIAKRLKKTKVFSFARAMEKDVESALDCGCHGVCIEIPIGQPKLQYQFGWTVDHVLGQSIKTIKRAKELGLYTVYFPYDTTRAPLADIEYLLKRIMEESPPDSVVVVDTMGCAIPAAIQYLVKFVKNITKLPVEIHTHNDFGQGVATELAAVEAGASVIHSCVNGLGERTGNAALEELAVSLKAQYGYEWGFKFDKVGELSRVVQELTRFPMPPNKPVVGTADFTRESGIGIEKVLEQPLAMFAMHPAFVGQQAKAVLGKKSGYPSILVKMRELNMEYAEDRQKYEVILQKIKQLGTEKRTLITDDEFKSIVKEVLG